MKNMFDKRAVASFKPEPMWVKIYDLLREAIITGDIEPGERINEAMIASIMGISRVPIREAIRHLESMNFVKTIPMRGSFVAHITIKEIEELFIVLKPNEGLAVQLAAENAYVAKQNEGLISIIEKVEQNKALIDDFALINEIDEMLHDFIFNHSGNDLLNGMLKSLLYQRDRLHKRIIVDNESSKIVHANIGNPIDEMTVVAHAMLKGDAMEAKRLMEKHVSNARERTYEGYFKNLNKDSMSRSTPI